MPPPGGGIVHGFHARRRSVTDGTGRACGGLKARATPRASAIGWMLVTGLLFVAVTGIVRHLGSDLPAVQAAFLRYVIGLGFMLPFLHRTLRVHLIPRRLGLHVLRGMVHGGGVILWFFTREMRKMERKIVRKRVCKQTRKKTEFNGTLK